MEKINGFSCPLHPWQILSWLWIIWHSTLPGAILPIKTNSPTYLLLPLLFYLIWLFVIIFGFLLTKSNPSQSKSIDPIKYFLFRLNPSQHFAYYCFTCKIYVQKSSKHCGMCRKCIEGFDHHCKWLNNCIGSKNYRLFLKFLVLVIVYYCVLITYEAVSIKDSKGYKKVILLIDLSANILVFILVGLLGIFHCYLNIKGIGTYEFFVRSNKNFNQVCIEETNENEKNCGKNLDILSINQINIEEKDPASDNLNLN